MSDVFRELMEAEVDEHCPYPKHKGFRGAFVKGWLAGAVRDRPKQCPYDDDGKTFSTAYARSWKAGYVFAKEQERKVS